MGSTMAPVKLHAIFHQPNHPQDGQGCWVRESVHIKQNYVLVEFPHGVFTIERRFIKYDDPYMVNEFKKLCRKYDMYFEMSDDPSAYKRGLKLHGQIVKASKSIENPHAIWEQVRPRERCPFD